MSVGTSTPLVCSVNANVVSFIAAGTCTVTVDAPANANYNAAATATQSFAVGKGSQSLSFTSTAPLNAVVFGSTYSVSGVSSVGSLIPSFSIDSSTSTICSISGQTVSFLKAGACLINMNQPGSLDYAAAPTRQQDVIVGKGSQIIQFLTNAPAATVNGPTYVPAASSNRTYLSVSLSVAASSASVCGLSGGVVSFIGVGSCVLNANQAGDVDFNAAPQVRFDLSVSCGWKQIFFFSLSGFANN